MEQIDLETAWAAGLFEGEGCIAVDNRSKGSIRLVMASTDKDVIDRFHNIVGCGRVRHIDYSGRGYKDQWEFGVFGDDAEFILHVFLPFLGDRRRRKAEEVLAARDEMIREWTRERECPGCGVVFAPEWGPKAFHVKFCSKQCRLRFHSRASYLRRLDRDSAMERVGSLSWA